MREPNFLPHEIKDRIFKKKENFLKYSIFFLLMCNIFIILHIFYGVYEINLKNKMVINVQSKVFEDSYEGKVDVLDFFKKNIIGHFLFEEANIKGSTLNLKIIINNKNEFSKCVKDLEKIKECNIQYLTAPYEENDFVKFEVALEVKEWKLKVKKV